jgi:DNA polymerase-3 subunit gamma/tau
MASQSLYRKWRSQTFSDLVGQEAIVRTLKNALKNGKPAHAYLFTGPRGTGKTSTARLLAKTINCLDPKDGEPCNECQQCREITVGTSFNVIEIDAASNRGIDSIRELRDKVMMPPVTGKYKVYILDEAHMLTTEAFNALLKTLEEPPKHAIFVLATTDVHKMLPTVLSRCQRFDFKRITTQRIVEHLSFVAEQEHIKLESAAAELIARAAAGGMRDALSLLDQAMAYCGQEISLEQVQAMLGVADPHAIQKFILHIAHLESAAGLHLIHELAEAGADLRQINTQVADYWRGLMLAKAGANVATILDRTEDEVHEIMQMMQYFSLEELTECARIFAQNDLLQKNQGTPQLALELALLSCIELHRRMQGGQSVTRTAQALSTPIVSVPPAQSVQPRSVPAQEAQHPSAPPLSTPSPNSQWPKKEELQTPPPISIPSSSRHEEYNDEEPQVDHVPAVPSTSVPQEREEHTVSEAIADAPTLTVQQLKEKWEAIKRRAKTHSSKEGTVAAAILNSYSIVAVEGTAREPVVVITPTTNSKFHYNEMQKPEMCKAAEWAMKLELGHACRLRILPFGQNHSSSIYTSSPPGRSSADDTDQQFRQELSMMQVMEPPPAPASPSPAVRERSSTSSAPRQRQAKMTRGVLDKLDSREQPLARTKSVRENTITASATTRQTTESRQERTERKAKGDPVVQEVARIFKAEIKEIQPK